MINVYIGFDAREAVAWSVLAHSIHARASQPVTVAPLMLSQLKDVFTRERHPLQSTDFSFSRFLVPWLSEYRGWALFTDCDMLVREDIAKLWALRDDRYAVMCVKHHHVPQEEIKFLGAPQSKYEKKNWSSVMLFNNARCRALTPEYVNTATGLELHQFKWLGDDGLIGELPHGWNYLVDSDCPQCRALAPDKRPLVHYTVGGPYFEKYRDCEYATEWRAELARMTHADERTRGI